MVPPEHPVSDEVEVDGRGQAGMVAKMCPGRPPCRPTHTVPGWPARPPTAGRRAQGRTYNLRSMRVTPTLGYNYLLLPLYIYIYSV